MEDAGCNAGTFQSFGHVAAPDGGAGAIDEYFYVYATLFGGDQRLGDAFAEQVTVKGVGFNANGGVGVLNIR